MVLELRPSHDPTRTFGFVGVVISLKDLSASIWMWKRDNGNWSATKVIEIPAEPADPDLLPPLLKGFKAVPPLVTDINLSLDDKWLYVSGWVPQSRRPDVSVPDRPKLASVIQIGGIVRKASHPKEPDAALGGGPQMVEVSRDGQRVYFTNSLYDPGKSILAGRCRYLVRSGHSRTRWITDSRRSEWGRPRRNLYSRSPRF